MTNKSCLSLLVPPGVICAVLATAVMMLCSAASAQLLSQTTADIGALKKLAFEELFDIEITTVARRPERLVDAASAVQVISAEDIRRSGATSLPEALRLAANLQVAQINSYNWAISARGFNATTANKLLVLIDGRSVYTPLFSGVFWDVQNVMLEDIDRIEVISGPGATLSGFQCRQWRHQRHHEKRARHTGRAPERRWRILSQGVRQWTLRRQVRRGFLLSCLWNGSQPGHDRPAQRPAGERQLESRARRFSRRHVTSGRL